MTLSKIELDLLKLAALCKDIPIDCHELFSSEIFSIDFIESLRPYIGKSKNGLSYRLSEEGYLLLKRLDIPFSIDSFHLGKGKPMNRRLANAKVVMTMYCAEIPLARRGIPKFYPTFVFRRENPKGTILGSSQMSGLLETPDITYIVFYADKTMKLKLAMELEAAKRFAFVINAGTNFSVLVLGDTDTAVNDWFEDNKLHINYRVATISDEGAKQLHSLCYGDSNADI